MKIKQIGNPKTPSKYNRALDPIEMVLQNRGIENVDTFFEHSWDCVQEPYALDNIKLAAERIIGHLKTAKTVAMLVDCDADGFTSVATLWNYLEAARQHQPDAAWDGNVPDVVFMHHEGKVHGLDDTKVMKDLRDLVKPALLIVTDASGTRQQYEALQELSIDVVVLDHHETKETGNNKDVIVVNNQHSEQYLNKALSGVGVTWQTCRVMDDILNLQLANNYIDLVAIGLVADVMDLRSAETRFLVREGLANIQNPLLQHFLFANDYRLGGNLTPTKVAFNIAPLFNAITRIGSIEEKDYLLRALFDDANTKEVPSGNRNSKGQMVPLVVEAYRLISNAKSRQTRREEKLKGLIDDVIHEEGLLENKVLVITIGQGDFEEEHRSLAGLVCNKLQEYYQRPAIIAFQNEDGTYSGSVRAPDTIEAFAEFRTQCEESGLCRYALGHGQAFGIAFTGLNSSKLQEYFNEKYENVDVDPTYYCDFIFDSNDPGVVDVIESLAQFESFWGQGLKEPVIALTDVLVGPGTLSLVGQNKGRPTLRIQSKHNVMCIRFGSSKEEFDSLCLPYEGTPQFYRATIVGTASVNEWQGSRTPQIMIKDYEIHGVGYDF